MADFRRMLGFLAYYKFNAIILEIGGATEYHRHPEVNAAWSEFCTDMHRYSGRSMEVQRGYPREKNSIHCDNGGGDVLTQAECREIADYCRARGLEVIPECPTLSHSDYLVMAHPELREREENPYPDTYCPMHPDRTITGIIYHPLPGKEDFRVLLGTVDFGGDGGSGTARTETMASIIG